MQSQKPFLPPAYVVRREGTVFTGVCLFTGGVPLSGPDGGGGYPGQVQMGVPQSLMEYPPPPAKDGLPPLSRRTDGVFDTRRAVRLLRSRRRTFLFINCVCRWYLILKFPILVWHSVGSRGDRNPANTYYWRIQCGCTNSPLGPISFIFMQFVGKIWRNNSPCPLPTF